MSYIGNQPAANYTGNIFVQQFSGDGIIATFILNDFPISVVHTDLFIGGVYQNKNTYSVNGNILTCSEAPSAGENNVEIKIFEVLPIGETSAGLVSFVANEFSDATTVQDVLIQLLNAMTNIDDYELITGFVQYSSNNGTLTADDPITQMTDFGGIY